MPELRGLLLDFDGTIAETERFGHRVAYNCAFAEMGLGWIWDESLYGELLRVAGGKERVRSFIERHHPHLLDDALASNLIPGFTRPRAATSRDWLRPLPCARVSCASCAKRPMPAS